MTEQRNTTVTPELLRDLAGERSFERGKDYFAGGAVRALRREAGGVKASVQGRQSYRVRLALTEDGVESDCSCPMGGDGYFCKHCVAVGLAWHADTEGAGSDDDETAVPSADDIRNHLMGLDKAVLVSMLLDQADEDERLYRSLMVSAARTASQTLDRSVWKRALDQAVSVGEYVPYAEARDFASGIEEMIDSLPDLLEDGHAEDVIELAEYGLEKVEESLRDVDDSGGWVGGLLHQLQDIHLQACMRALPEPTDLAERLFEREMGSDVEVFYGAAESYAEVLGDTGLAAYRRRAEAEWADVPSLGPGDKDPLAYGRRFRITSIMEGMARATDDLEALVAVKSRDLSSPYAFLRIAELYREAGDGERALDWAERGWRAFPKNHDSRLREFLAEAYRDRGRHDEAIGLMWQTFVDRPRLEAYRQLESHARAAREWPRWREQALAAIRQQIADASSAPPGRRPWGRTSKPDHSLLVEVFLHEGDVDAAWQEAETGGCSSAFRLALAERRGASHPADAVRIYQDHVADLLRSTGDSIYSEAVATLEKIGKLLAQCDREEAFRAYLGEIRATQKRKRNLMKMLDRKGW